jgi:signal peptidase I
MVKKMPQELNQSQGKKEPWLAVNLSLFFPGIGQFYAQKFTKAFVISQCNKKN